MFRILSVALISLVGFSASAQSTLCTDFDSALNPPSLQYPSRTGFRYFWNSWLANDEPFHMGHDQILPEYTPATVTGKFDYGFVFHKDLEYERVKAYIYGTGMSDWQYLGRYTTNGDGKIYVDVPPLAAGQYVIRMVVLGDLSEAEAYVTVIRPGTKAVVFDIDETLTRDDLEQILDYTGIEWAEERGGASELVNSYIDLGYHPVFLTARVYWYAKGSREWLANYLGVPKLTLRTSLSNEASLFETVRYKANALREFQNAGLDIVRVYGNADTDIQAYEEAGIAKSETFIIGDQAGSQGTQPIYEGHYYNHLDTVVAQTPFSNCIEP